MKEPTKMPQPYTNSPFDMLTDEIIYTILDQLKTHPFANKSFSLTCKAFYIIESRHRRTIKPLCIQLLKRTSFRFPFIAQLDLSLCAQVDDNALNVVSSSPTWKYTLRSVNLSRSRLFSEVGLSSLCVNCVNLVEIDLSNMSEVGDVAAVAIAEAKNLERLWLARCKLITDMGIARVAIGCRKLKLLSLKWCLRIGDLGVGLVALKCKEIRTLDLSYLPITEQCLLSVMQLQYLEDLILEGCHSIDDDGLATLEQSCKSLKVLNIAKCEHISHVGFSRLTNGAASLQQLTLAYSLTFTADLSKCLQNFPALQSVKLDGCSFTCSGITAIGNWCAPLKELSLRACSGLTDEQLSFLVQSHKGLRKLDITCCRMITYVSFDNITNSCTSLTSLRMECCSSVSKEAFTLIGQRCQYLEELDVTDNGVDDEGLKSISKCSKILILKLGICPNITDTGLTYVGRGCSKLKALDLYSSTGITDMGLAAISHGCSSLEEVNLAYNDRITDASLTSLSKCSNLKVLEIRGCTHVSSVGLSAISMGCRQLTVLDIKKCININDNAMLPLALYSLNLKQINLSYCSVTDAGLVTLANINHLQNMTILHLAGVTPNGLAAALLACRRLNKVKLHASFKPLLHQSFLGYMEARGCVFHWRDKALL